MTSQQTTVPVGAATLGRILDSDMEPIDGLANHFGDRIERLKVGEYTIPEVSNRKLFQVGIKPFDLFAPVPRNGVVSLIATWAVGKIVLLNELIRTMKVVYGGRSIVITVEGGPRELVDVESSYREFGVFDSVTVILIPRNAPAQAKRNAVLGGLTMARHSLDVEGKNVLLAVDQLALDEETVAMLKGISLANDPFMVTVVSGYHRDEVDSESRPVPVNADARITFSPELARRGLYPAIDPFTSESAIFNPDVLGERHVDVVRKVRKLLQRGRDLAGREEGGVSDTISEEERVIVERARRLERFLTQPFYVAQLQNGIPGEQVGIEESLDAFEALLDGEYDDLPIEAFNYVGTVGKN